MKDYQQKKLKQFVLPEPVYRQALWAAKDLERLKSRLRELREDAYVLEGHDISASSAGYRTGRVSDSTGSKAVEITHLARRIEAIELALLAVPQEYRDGIHDKIIYGLPYTGEAHINTWKRWQQVFLYNVAVNLHIL